MELGHDVTFDEFMCSHIWKIVYNNNYCYSNLFQKLEIELKEKIIHEKMFTWKK